MKQALETPAPDEFLETTAIALQGELLWDTQRGHATKFTASAELTIETSALVRASMGGRERTVESGNTIAMLMSVTETITTPPR